MSDSPPKPPEANVERAIIALERAVIAATTGEVSGDVVVAQPGDFLALKKGDRARVRECLDQVLMARHPGEGLDALLASGALGSLLPDVEKMVGFGDGEWRHKDVWKHTKQVVWQSVPRLEVRWGALLHDIGKVKTRTISPNGEVHFFGHAEVGARMFDRLERRMGLFQGDKSLKKAVRFLILHHLRPAGYDRKWTDSAVRRFGREMEAHLDDLLCLARADITTKRPAKKRRGLRNISELHSRLRKLQEIDARVPPLPKGLGTGIMDRFSVPPSKLLGDIKRALEAEVEAGRLEAGRETGYYVEFIEKQPELFGLPK